MANQLQRDLGHKLISVDPIEDTIEAPITPSTIESPILVLQAPCTPSSKTTTCQSREDHSSSNIGDGKEDNNDLPYGDATESAESSAFQQPDKSSSDYNLSKSQLIESMDRISIAGGGHSRKPSTGVDQEQEQSLPTKK